MTFIEQIKGMEIPDEQKQKLISEYEADVTGLKNKNSELLGSVKNYKTKLSEFEGVDVEVFKELKTKAEEHEQAKMLEEKRYTELLAKHEETNKSLQEKIAILNNEKKTNFLTSELVKAGVKPELLEIAKGHFNSKAELRDNGEVVIDGLDATEFMKTWIESDTGKQFIKAPANNGAGQTGTPGINVNKSATEEAHELNKSGKTLEAIKLIQEAHKNGENITV
jgi:hypothetical protein